MEVVLCITMETVITSSLTCFLTRSLTHSLTHYHSHSRSPLTLTSQCCRHNRPDNNVRILYILSTPTRTSTITTREFIVENWQMSDTASLKFNCIPQIFTMSCSSKVTRQHCYNLVTTLSLCSHHYGMQLNWVNHMSSGICSNILHMILSVYSHLQDSHILHTRPRYVQTCTYSPSLPCTPTGNNRQQ